MVVAARDLAQTIERLPTSTGNRLHISPAEAARAMANFIAVGTHHDMVEEGEEEEHCWD